MMIAKDNNDNKPETQPKMQPNGFNPFINVDFRIFLKINNIIWIKMYFSGLSKDAVYLKERTIVA